jgi:hypothetical protein
MRVGFDLDGVLYNFGDSVKRYLEATDRGHIWKSGPTPAPFWDFYKDWGWSSAEFVQMCNEGADAGYIFCGPARHNASKAVNAVKEMGHEVVIITDRQFGSSPYVSHRNTQNWLKKHGIPFDELYFSADKTCVPTDMFVEDKLENYDALDAAGVEVYLINRKWNYVDGDGDERRRIRHIMQYVEAVERRAVPLRSVRVV